MKNIHSVLKKIFLLPVMFYRKFLSPLKGQPVCKYYPSCSKYFVTAVEKHGIIKGTILGTWRVLRCNPWSMGGIDYVPEEFSLFKFKKKK